MTTLTFERLAHQHFEYARYKAFWRDLSSRLTRKCNGLLALDRIYQERSLKGQYYRGLQVPYVCTFY